jgi:hypothetical protein
MNPFCKTQLLQNLLQKVPIMNSTPISPSTNRGSKVSTTHKPTVPQTRYIEMLLQEKKEVPQTDNILASFFTWLSLASYVVFPGTFTSWRNSHAIKDVTNDSVIATAIYDSVRNIPLLAVATACCVVGTSGVVWLWLRWNSNFVWLVEMIFLYETSPIPEFPKLTCQTQSY